MAKTLTWHQFRQLDRATQTALAGGASGSPVDLYEAYRQAEKASSKKTRSKSESQEDTPPDSDG